MTSSPCDLSRYLEPLLRVEQACSKPALCYPCALRMATMFNVRPPPSRAVVMSHLSAQRGSENCSGSDLCAWQPARCLPLVCVSANRLFNVVYETADSARRIWQPEGETLPSISFERPFCVKESTSTPLVCVACCGLYQFLDDVTVPLLAASVRVSPYLDSVEITTNVNCPRAMTFVWLAAATLFRAGSGEQARGSKNAAEGCRESVDNEALTTGGSVDGPSSSTADVPSVKEAMTRRLPKAEDIIPEGFANFKDFFMADVRARALRYLSRPLAGPLSESADVGASDEPGAYSPEDLVSKVLVAAQQQRRQGAAQSVPPSRPRVDADEECASATEQEALGKREDKDAGVCAGEQPRVKRPRTEEEERAAAGDRGSIADVQPKDHARLFSESNIATLCSQALRYAPLDGGVILDVDVVCPSCYEDVAIPEKHLLGNAAAAAAAAAASSDSQRKSIGQHPRGGGGALRHLASVIPPVYCSNKSGSVMQYRVLYEFMFPYLLDQRLGAYRGVLSDAGVVPIATAATATLQGCIVAGVRSSVSHGNVFLIGRYRKLLRSLSQSPWFHEGGRIGSFSLQEIIADPFLTAVFPFGVPRGLLPSNVARRQARAEEYFSTLGETARAELEQSTQRKCRNRLPGGQASPWQEVDPFQVALEEVRGYGWYKFHSAGREDVDVRMLGSGRPFVLELVAPHRQRFTADELRALEAEVNASHEGSVEISGVAYTQSEITQILARHSESKTKTYRCVVWSSRGLDANDALLTGLTAIKDLTISQRTPLRVLHRRSLLERQRTIHSISYQRVNDHWLVVDLETQAGTYVKEFIHGDCGRTTPNLGILLQSRTDIVQLDVLGMVMADDVDATR